LISGTERPGEALNALRPWLFENVRRFSPSSFSRTDEALQWDGFTTQETNELRISTIANRVDHRGAHSGSWRKNPVLTGVQR
jgi:hypothetical protein